MARRLPDRSDWFVIHNMPRNGDCVAPSLASDYDRAAAAGLCERGDTDAYGFVSFFPTAFGRAWLRLYNAKASRDPSPTAGEVATIRETLRGVQA